MALKPRGSTYSLVVFFALTIIFTGASTVRAASLTKIAQDSIGAIAAAEISCHMDDITSGISSIFGGGDGEDGGGIGTGDSVPINAATMEKLQRGIKATSKETSEKLNCTNAVEKAAAQTILKELTMNTVNWINRGFKGESPLYIGDTSHFLKGIEKQVIGEFSLNISDPTKFPFGKTILKELMNSTKTYFEDASQYSLNEAIQARYPTATSADFMANFSVGGWEGLLSQSQIGNNPFGFGMAAGSELSQRIEGTNISLAEDVRLQLQRNQGFLDLRHCVNPSDYDDDANKLYAAQAKLKANPNDTTARDTVARGTCTQWKTDTPGSVVINQLNTALGTPTQQLVFGQDLTSSLTAIFDALANQLVSKGLSSLSSSSDDTSGTQDILSGSGTYTSNIVEGDGTNGDGSWLQNGERFDVFIDIPRVIVIENNAGKDTWKNMTSDQRAYQLKTNPFNDTSLPDGFQQVLARQIPLVEELIPEIYKLDFCVPGPHPGWETDTRNNMQSFVTNQDELPANSDSAISSGAKIFSFITDPGGMFKQTGKDMTMDKRNEKMYSAIVGSKLTYNAALPNDTSVGIDESGGAYSGGGALFPGGVNVTRNVHVNGYNHVVNLFYKLLERYTNAMESVYAIDAGTGYADLMEEISINNKTFPQIATYRQGIIDNEKLYNKSFATVTQLLRLSARINALPSLSGYPGLTAEEKLIGATVHDYHTDLLTVESDLSNRTRHLSDISEYEHELKRISETFSLIAPNIHSSSDVTKQENTYMAVVESLASQKDEVAVCIKDTASAGYTGPQHRVAYPKEITEQLGYYAQEFRDFENKFKVGTSFLPDWKYAQGFISAPTAGTSTTESTLLGFSASKKEIINDDVVTISSQPTTNALAGLEQLIGIY